MMFVFLILANHMKIYIVGKRAWEKKIKICKMIKE